MNTRRGFNLIEFLIVIAIIGILTAILLYSFKSASARARDTTRKSDLKQLQLALERYYYDHDSYPSTVTGPQQDEFAWLGVSPAVGSKDVVGADGYIPNLAPTYIDVLPVDPLDVREGYAGYQYKSNGFTYKILSHVEPLNSTNTSGPEKRQSKVVLKPDEMKDPKRPQAWMVCGGDISCKVYGGDTVCPCEDW